MGKTITVNEFKPYGFCSNTPLDSLGVLFNINNDNQEVMFSNQPKRFKGLKEWEVQIGNFDTESSIKFLENGNVEIDAKAGKISIKNDDEELIQWLNEFIDGLVAMTTATAIGPQPPINLAIFTDLQTRIAALKA